MSLVTPVAVSLWTTITPLMWCPVSARSASSMRVLGRAFAPLDVEHLHVEAQALHHVDPQVAELAEARRQHLVARARACW